MLYFAPVFWFHPPLYSLWSGRRTESTDIKWPDGIRMPRISQMLALCCGLLLTLVSTLVTNYHSVKSWPRIIFFFFLLISLGLVQGSALTEASDLVM